MSERINAVYRLSTSADPHRTAALIAGEQSSGTFVAIPGEDDALKARAAATFEIQALDEALPFGAVLAVGKCRPFIAQPDGHRRWEFVRTAASAQFAFARYHYA